MSDINESSLRRAVLRHRPDLEADPLRFEPIPTGKFNTSFFVMAPAEQLVLRIAPPTDAGFVFYERHMMRQEPAIHRLLLERTGVPVARIFAFDDSAHPFGRTFLLMQRLPGRPFTETFDADPNTVLQQVGRHLAATHSLTADRHGYLGEHRPMPPMPTWVEAFDHMWNRMIDDVAAAGYYDSGEQARMRELFATRRPYFDRPLTPRLLHMDIWHQNILVDDDARVTGLLDWDRALWGDPEIEFAVLDYCGISTPAFWEGYGTPRDDSPEARVRQVFYLLYELQKYIVIRHARNGRPAAAERYKRQVLERVRHAFDT